MVDSVAVVVPECVQVTKPSAVVEEVTLVVAVADAVLELEVEAVAFTPERMYLKRLIPVMVLWMLVLLVHSVFHSWYQ
jgi:hypothetical protein